ncbi:hypothetical protein Adeh_1848 [Anaeromyxobacter dehalogenans 2CP-C]|uniref:Uncharacterized protein n=1 Tax=Anaeromyxobacter dehalogenans (strain 2CP-C) TaxID=290397 RepID=Q2IIZ1_ANADE|nr:hypothetical protein Adeh_1848 [Anaeromyxobacter dehalogenans 2CP-C]
MRALQRSAKEITIFLCRTPASTLSSTRVCLCRVRGTEFGASSEGAATPSSPRGLGYALVLKLARFHAQIGFAAAHGELDRVDRFLPSLPPKRCTASRKLDRVACPRSRPGCSRDPVPAAFGVRVLIHSSEEALGFPRWMSASGWRVRMEPVRATNPTHSAARAKRTISRADSPLPT